MKWILLLGLLLFLSACTSETAQCPENTVQEETTTQINTKESYCPFGKNFTSPHYIQQDYFTIKPILSVLDASTCDEELLTIRNTTNGFCRIQHAEIIQNTGRIEGKDTYQWKIDCACSYE
jgi:hypothetical protein